MNWTNHIILQTFLKKYDRKDLKHLFLHTNHTNECPVVHSYINFAGAVQCPTPGNQGNHLWFRCCIWKAFSLKVSFHLQNMVNRWKKSQPEGYRDNASIVNSFLYFVFIPFGYLKPSHKLSYFPVGHTQMSDSEGGATCAAVHEFDFVNYTCHFTSQVSVQPTRVQLPHPNLHMLKEEQYLIQ